MKKEMVFFWLRQLFLPVLTAVLGLSLLIHPDAASALVGKILGWGLVIAGAVSALDALNNRRSTVRKVIAAVAGISLGIWLVAHPLALAALAGRILGIVLAVKGIQDLLEASRLGLPRGLPAVTTAAGALLALLPMTASRLLLQAVGLVLLGIGICMVVTRLRIRKKLDGPEDPNIIDAL